MRINFVIESTHAPKFAFIFTENVPAVKYVFKGFVMLEVVPSPKVHVTKAGVGKELSEKITGVLWQAESAALNKAFTCPSVTAFGFTMVSLQPLLFVIIRLTV